MYGFALAVRLPTAKAISYTEQKSGLVYKCDKVNQQTWKMMFTLSFTTSLLSISFGSWNKTVSG